MKRLLRDPRLWVVLGAALLFLPGLGNHDLWNPDEPRYAEVAREMLLTGDFLVPHLDAEIYTQKPPLHFWAIAAAGALRGSVDEVAARLPSALAAILATLLVFALGDRLFGRRAAWLAAIVFATSAKIEWQARTGQIDMVLCALVALGVYLWVRGWLEQRPWLARAFFVTSGLAILAKGPAGFLPPLLAIVGFLLWTRDREGMRQLRPFLGFLVTLGIALAWLVPAGFSAGNAYLENILYRQNVTRFANPWHHIRPFYYYLQVVPGDFFPWSLFLPLAWVAGRRELVGRERRGFLFATFWVVTTIVFFSLSPAKRSVYVLSMYPALALLVGAGLDRAAAVVGRYRHWLGRTSAVLAGLLALVAIVLPFGAQTRPEVAVLDPSLVPTVTAAVAILALAAFVGWFLARRRFSAVAVVAAIALGAVAMSTIAIHRVLPLVDPVKSARPLSEELLARRAPGEPWALYPDVAAAFLYYVGDHAVLLSTEEELRDYLAGPGRRWVLADDLALRKIHTPLPAEIVSREPDPAEAHVLMKSLGGKTNESASEPR